MTKSLDIPDLLARAKDMQDEWGHTKKGQCRTCDLIRDLAAALEEKQAECDCLVIDYRKEYERAERAEAEVVRLTKREELYLDPTCALFVRTDSPGSEHACVRYKRERDAVMELLRWLNARGGLGLDVHARIDALLAKGDKA